MWWGLSLGFWESVFFWAVWIAAIAGGISVTAAAVSAVVGYRVTDVIQRESNERIAKSEEKIAEANRIAAEANEKAESERLARMKIEEKLAPRSLTLEQQTFLINKLKPFAGTLINIFIHTEGTADIKPLSKQISSILNAADWKLLVLEAKYSAIPFSGVIISTRNDPEKKFMPAAMALVEGLNSEGIATNFRSISVTRNTQIVPIGGDPEIFMKAPIIMVIATKP